MDKKLRKLVEEIFDDFSEESYFDEMVKSKSKELESLIKEEHESINYYSLILSISPFPSYIDIGSSKYIDKFEEDLKPLAIKLKSIIRSSSETQKEKSKVPKTKSKKSKSKSDDDEE